MARYDNKWAIKQLIIMAIILYFVIFVLGCAISEKERVQKMYPDCWVTDDIEIICPEMQEMLRDADRKHKVRDGE